MKIYCVRHGHAAIMPGPNGHRQLSEQGIEDVSRVARYLAYRDFQVAHILHSHKQRAKQTADILGAHLGLKPEESPLLAPESSIIPLIEHIQKWDEDTLLVGHMPFVSFLLSTLVVGNDEHSLALFAPGTMVCLERYDGNRWIINWLLHPELAPENPVA